jgi:hypothetical protein
MGTKAKAMGPYIMPDGRPMRLLFNAEEDVTRRKPKGVATGKEALWQDLMAQGGSSADPEAAAELRALAAQGLRRRR